MNTSIRRFLFAFSLSLAVLIGNPQLSIGQESYQNDQFWTVSGSNAIVWDLEGETKLPHEDNIEMSGQRVAAIVTYEVDEEKNLSVTRDIIYPQLRIYIESSANRWRKYRAYLRDEYDDEFLPTVVIDERTYEPGKLDSVGIDGHLKFFHSASQGITVQRTLLPSMTERLFVEGWRLNNNSDSTKHVRIGRSDFVQRQVGQNGSFVRRVYSDVDGEFNIRPGESLEFAVFFSAQLNDEAELEDSYSDVAQARRQFLDQMNNNLIVETPDPMLNRLFQFSKVRASESIYDTKMGLVHSPGGGRYYTGVWANDQAEYSGPFFPFLGYDNGNVAAMNAYRHFLKNIPEGEGNFWSSFEMEGTVVCCGGDRGDAAMISFGASQYALLSGDAAVAEEIWPLIEWSLDYSARHTNEAGVVTSDSDEMEGRIATGGANLATSSLHYGALKQAALLSKALGHKRSKYRRYEREASQVADAIESYFGAEIDGLDTYQYFDGHPYLRHWISLPLVMGIDNRKDGTLDALFTKLWTNNGVKVEHNPTLEEPNLFWDRGTLYAFRGAFKAGAANRALEKLREYSQTRLLGFHVPYVVEAWPEGNMAHLSAESALYCRIYTEGILGMTATGFRSFEIAPSLPDEWQFFNVRKIHAFDSDFDVEITRSGTKLNVDVIQAGRTLLSKSINNGDRISVKLRS